MTYKAPWLLPTESDCKAEPDDQEELNEPDELEEQEKLEESEEQEEPGWEPGEPDEQEGIFQMLDVLEKATGNLLNR